MKGRIYFKSVRSTLVIQREQREAKANVLTLHESGKLYEAAALISRVKNLTPELQLMKSKLYYQLQDYEMCIKASLEGIGQLLSY